VRRFAAGSLELVKRFCALCGREETPDNPVVNGICNKCFIDTIANKLSSMHVDVTVCRSCRAFKIQQSKWVYPEGSEFLKFLSKYIEDKISRKLGSELREPVSVVDLRLLLNGNELHLSVELMNPVRGVLHVEGVLKLKMHRTLCPRCQRRAAKSYDYVIQLRTFSSRRDTLNRLLRDIEDKFGESVTIEEEKNGYDIKLLDKEIANRILMLIRERVGANRVKVTVSYGDERISREGKRKAKMYISVRVLDLEPGDYVVYRGHAYIVTDVSNDDLILEDSAKNSVRVKLVDLLNRAET